MNIDNEALCDELHRGIAAREGETLQRVVYRVLRELILAGKLPAQSRLPGSRELASRLALSRNTLNAALEQLATEGYLLRNRRGNQVALLPAPVDMHAENVPEIVLPASLGALPPATRRESPAMIFTPGMPAVNYFPLPLWRRLLDRTMKEEGCLLLGYGDSAGEWPLRAAIARHLTLSRGIHCAAEQVIITEGALEGLQLCTQLLSERGQLAWVEEPGYFGARSAFVSAGLHIEGIPVDDQGMRLPAEPTVPPALIFTSPSHQFPLGSLMSASRRLALLKFAIEHKCWIIEDDYDSEFRYGSEPIPAMLGMLPQSPVVYLGTFSKTLFPSLRLGFVVMPPALARAAQPAIQALLRGGHRAEQRALARFIEDGHYARHLAAMRRLYRNRQQQLGDALRQTLTLPYSLSGEKGGMHLTVAIDAIDDVRIADEARRFQMAPAALSRFYLSPSAGKTGLVLGYGNTSSSQYIPALARLNGLITRFQRARE
ncbi:PLP-dependent aminotransferase family protein [uncultured Pluralibacter sp.]|uniref:MocR-like pyridoxine biosynthesis transcription factor PdxR n=1 Tax=uncultured Pluralibacter sp. TaxID=1490864 RepID=UPI0026155655|nr:PLP-dependent aminotransferase family protein [uncultured Pluralibacter sp.]